MPYTFNEGEIHKILSPAKLSIDHFRVVEIDALNWAANYHHAVLSQHHEANQCIILIVNNIPRNIKVSSDVFFLCGKTRDLIATAFVNMLNAEIFCLAKSSNLLTYFRQRWQANDSSYPVFIYMTLNENCPINIGNDYNSTIHISYLAVAPFFRKKGLMKKLTVCCLKAIQQAKYLGKIGVTALTYHPATYLFFYPKSKNLSQYRSGDLQERNLNVILDDHAPSCQSAAFTPIVIPGLAAYFNKVNQPIVSPVAS